MKIFSFLVLCTLYLNVKCFLSSLPFYCQVKECCDDRWIKKDIARLHTELNNNFCGQLTAKNIVIEALEYHWNDAKRNKPLVLSFHGPPGAGKTFLAFLIRNAIFEKGENTRFFYYNSGRLLGLQNDTHRIAEDKKTIGADIKKAVQGCEHAVIVLDDIHVIHPELLDSILPYIDNVERVDGVDYRNATFILISNTASFGLIDIAEQEHEKGRSAHDLPYLEVERIVEALSFNDASSSFYQSELVLSKLIDYYVPFFPMPEQEVECCILLELAGNKTFEMRSSLEKRAVLDEILKRYNFLPDHNPWYADFGCKSVKKAVNLFDIE